MHFGDVAAAGTERLFTGQIEDADAGLNFYNARYLGTGIGRFISPDSIIPNPSDPRDHNRYTYVRNNPLKYTDPTGHVVFCICVSLSGAIAGQSNSVTIGLAIDHHGNVAVIRSASIGAGLGLGGMVGLAEIKSTNSVYDLVGHSTSFSGCAGFKLAGCVNWSGGWDISITAGVGYVASVGASDSETSITIITDITPEVARDIIQNAEDPLAAIERMEKAQLTGSKQPGWSWGNYNIGGGEEESSSFY